MDLLGAWIAYPLVALIVFLGLGLLIERAGGQRLPGVLILPVGAAGLIAASQLTTYWSWSAPLTLPLVIALTIAGLVLGRGRRADLRLDRWAIAAFVGVLAVYGAPVVLSGHATFAGYTVLGDTSIHFIGADALLKHGRDFSNLPPSSYEYSLVAYYGANGYPSGGPTAAGALTSLVGMDVSATFQTFLSLLAALSALTIYGFLIPFVSSRPLRAGIAFVAAQPALFVAYALQGSVKEVGAAFLVLLLGALAAVYVRSDVASRRSWVALAVAAAALIGVVGLAAAVWLGPLILGTAVLRLVRTRRPVEVARDAIGFAIVMVALGYQSFIDAGQYVSAAGSVLHAQQEFGNLARPLKDAQMFGVWITGDYRTDPQYQTLTTVLIVVVAIAAVAGIVWLVRGRAWPELLFLAVCLFAWWYVTRSGSPWADGKALMILSPAVLLAAGLGAAAAASLWRWAAGAALVAVVALGVLMSNAYAYHDVSDAPHDRMAELEQIGARYDGEGPTLYTEFEEFGKHYLRDTDPEGSSEGWQRRYALSLGKQPPTFGVASDTDQFSDRYLTYYRTIVVRQGFEMSRPPSIYRRTFHGRYYDVFQRTAPPGRLLGRLTFGVPRQPASFANCAAVRSFARQARGAGAHLEYLARPQNIVGVPASITPLPAGWFVDGTDGAMVHPAGPGRVQIAVRVPRAARYDVWLEGSVVRGVDVLIDKRHVGHVANELSNRRTSVRVGSIQLSAGRHLITTLVGGGDLRPGNGGPSRLLGPIGLTPADPGALPVRRLAPSRWRQLCGRSLDWIDAVR